MGEAGALGGLFAVAFLAATVFPAQSETALAALLSATDHPAWLLVAIASLGNVMTFPLMSRVMSTFARLARALKPPATAIAFWTVRPGT